MAEYRLSDNEELDLICWNVYGDLAGSIEAVLRVNWQKLHLFTDLGVVKPLLKVETIELPSLQRPTAIADSIRVFN